MHAQEFQPKLAEVQDFPWNTATADDVVRRIACVVLGLKGSKSRKSAISPFGRSTTG